MRRLALLAALATVPPSAGALEPRFDHRDQFGPSLELMFASDTVALGGGTTATDGTPALRLAWSFDPFGEGNELAFGLRLSWPAPDPEALHVRAALDARYRAYWGSEELKTFLDVGLVASVASRWALGPLMGLGLQYDPSRAGGVFVSAGLGTGLGEGRLASFTLSAGAQLRFD